MTSKPSKSLGCNESMCLQSNKPRPHRRINGFQLPLHPQQVVGWLILIITAVLAYLLVIPALPSTFQLPFYIVVTLLYTMHTVAHFIVVFVDPAESQLRKMDLFQVPEFDRSKHEHVIENGRCHLCNIQISSGRTKHCSLCNKCVDCFDHHCKWLNHCIGKRNYKPFFLSVITATILAIVSSVMAVGEISIHFVHSASSNDSYRNETISTPFNNNDTLFLSLLSVFTLVSLILSCLLIHLCSFHVYISILGVSTYEYIRIHSVENHIDEERQNSSMGDSTQINDTQSCSYLHLYKSKKINNKVETFDMRDDDTRNVASVTENSQNTNVNLCRNDITLYHRVTHQINSCKQVSNLMANLFNKTNTKPSPTRDNQVYPAEHNEPKTEDNYYPSTIVTKI